MSTKTETVTETVTVEELQTIAQNAIKQKEDDHKAYLESYKQEQIKEIDRTYNSLKSVAQNGKFEKYIQYSYSIKGEWTDYLDTKTFETDITKCNILKQLSENINKSQKYKVPLYYTEDFSYTRYGLFGSKPQINACTLKFKW